MTTLAPARLTLCEQCGKDRKYKDGLCVGCHSIRTLRTVLDDPALNAESIRFCRNCGCMPVKTLGRCARCYTYFYRHRVERPPVSHPLRSVPNSAPCNNCGVRPIETKGRCHTCYQYLRKYGAERPRRLWRVKANGYSR